MQSAEQTDFRNWAKRSKVRGNVKLLFFYRAGWYWYHDVNKKSLSKDNTIWSYHHDFWAAFCYQAHGFLYELYCEINILNLSHITYQCPHTTDCPAYHCWFWQYLLQDICLLCCWVRLMSTFYFSLLKSGMLEVGVFFTCLTDRE